VARALRQGESIAWNPWSATGSPGFRSASDAKLAPRSLLAAVLGGGPRALTLATLATIVAAMAGIQHFVVWCLGLSRIAGLAASGFFVLNGFATSFLVCSVADPYWWSPLAMIALWAAGLGGPRCIVIGAVGQLPLIFATFIPVQLLCMLGAYGIVLAAARDTVRTALPRRLGTMVLSTLLATALAGAVVVPVAFGFLGATQDLDHYGSRLLAQRGWIDLPSLLTPRHAWDLFERSSFPAGLKVAEGTAWLGLGTLVLLAAGWHPTRYLWLRRITMVLAVLSLCMHFGAPGVRYLALLPLLRPISSGYWPALSMMAIAVAVALAVEGIRRHGPHLGAAAAVLVGEAAALAWVFNTAGAVPADTWRDDRAWALVLTLVVWLAGVEIARCRRGRAGVALLVVLFLFELGSYPGHETVEPFDVAQTPPVYLQRAFDELGRAGFHDRLFSAGNRNVQPEWGAALGIRQLGTLNSGQLPWYREFFVRYVNPSADRFLHVDNSHPLGFEPRALDLTAVRLIAVDDAMQDWNVELASRYPKLEEDRPAGIVLFENPSAWPRARLVETVTRQPTGGEPFSRWAAWTENEAWRRSLRLDADPVIASEERGTARIVFDGVTRVEVETVSDRPAVLVLADAWHPYWRATINGEAAEVARVDLAFRGVAIPAGTSHVRFEYHPIDLYLGLWVTFLTALCVLGWLAFRFAARRGLSNRATSRRTES
jgi:hypothetical protein